jgi:hypothetical protein
MRVFTPRSRLHGEHGASLALIMSLIVIIGIGVATMATQGTAGMMAVQGVHNQRSDVYGAENAVDATINYMRNDLTKGRFGTSTCPSTSPATIFTGPSDNGNVTVTCKSLTGSGVAFEGANYPAYAIQTTTGLTGYPTSICSGTGNPGICVDGNSSGAIKVDGAVSSNSAITASNSVDLNAGDDSVTAFGACSGTILGTPVICNTNTAVNDPGGPYNSDPATGPWASDIQSVPPTAPVPVCNPTSKVATMSPGSYFDRDAVLLGFTAVVSGKRISCPVVWMKPGDYYFDFAQSTDSDPWRIGYDDAYNTDHLYSDNFGSGTDIPGSVIIGGTLTSAVNPNASTSQVAAARAAIPGACNRAAAGVQVMMANYVAFDVKNIGMLELCPDPNTTKQQIALVGRKTDQTTAATTATFKPAGQVAPITGSGTPFAPGLVAIDGVVNTGNVNGKNASATVTLNGYAAPGVSPSQSISSVNFKVAHREVPNPTNSTLTISALLTTAGGSCTISGIPQSTTLTTFSKVLNSASSPSLSTCGITSLDDLTGATVKFTVTTPNSGSPSSQVDLDGIEIVPTYTPKGLQAKTAGSKIVWMYGDYGNQDPEIYIWGTVYAPTSRIELGFGSVATTIAQFERGAVVAAVKATSLTVSQSYNAFGNASGVPHYSNRYFELIASIGGTRQLRAVVRLDDTTDVNTPGKTVTIVSWNAAN